MCRVHGTVCAVNLILRYGRVVACADAVEPSSQAELYTFFSIMLHALCHQLWQYLILFCESNRSSLTHKAFQKRKMSHSQASRSASISWYLFELGICYSFFVRNKSAAHPSGQTAWMKAWWRKRGFQDRLRIARSPLFIARVLPILCWYCQMLPCGAPQETAWMKASEDRAERARMGMSPEISCCWLGESPISAMSSCSSASVCPGASWPPFATNCSTIPGVQKAVQT